MNRMTEFLQVTTAASSRDEAERIANALVEQRFAACAQVVGPIASAYRWQGRIERAEEWWCVAKTTRRRYDEAEALIRKLHSYECPEIIAAAIVAGSTKYLEWLHNQTSTAADESRPPE
jgi:periplasmic divalent cation tolerance protein